MPDPREVAERFIQIRAAQAGRPDRRAGFPGSPFASGGTIPPPPAATADRVTAFITHGPPDMDPGPTDVPPKDSYGHWHADEARALALLADLTAWSNDPQIAAGLMHGGRATTSRILFGTKEHQ